MYAWGWTFVYTKEVSTYFKTKIDEIQRNLENCPVQKALYIFCILFEAKNPKTKTGNIREKKFCAIQNFCSKKHG